MGAIETRKISKHFDGVTAVDGIDLEAREGEFLVLLGPSGCGKTTLLRMIAGLEEPTAGQIIIEGRDVTHLPPRARNIAMVFQSYALYPHLSVRKNIAFPLKALGMDRATIEQRVDWAAGMFGIARLLDRKPRQLSGGERQRVALARAVVREPVVFLLDEPLSNLDAKLRTFARDELQQFQRRLGTTTIYVTHDQVEAMGLGDRVAVLNEGRICQIGTPEEIYADPTDTFVATFIGAPPMNLAERGKEILGFRPEHMEPKGKGRKPDGALEIPMRVTRMEYLGADEMVYGELLPPFPDVKVVAKVPSSAPLPVKTGERAEFFVRAGHVKHFDLGTGARTDKRGVPERGRAAAVKKRPARRKTSGSAGGRAGQGAG